MLYRFERRLLGFERLEDHRLLAITGELQRQLRGRYRRLCSLAESPRGTPGAHPAVGNGDSIANDLYHATWCVNYGNGIVRCDPASIDAVRCAAAGNTSQPTRADASWVTCLG